MNETTTTQLLALKLRVIATLADTIAPSVDSVGIRRALNLISDETFSAAYGLSQLERRPAEVAK
jgi:hypothetical protein